MIGGSDPGTIPAMRATPLDRVLDYANARSLRVCWEKRRPGLWEVRITGEDSASGYGSDLQAAAAQLLRERLRDVDAEASKLSA